MRTNQALAYFFLRITMGVNMLIHGWVKLGQGYEPFVSNTRTTFEKTPVPDIFVRILAYAIPWAELLIGIALIIGLCTRISVIAAQVLIMVLIAGQCFLMQWEIVGIQLIYALAFTWLLYKGKHNEIAVDRYLKQC